MSSFAAIIIESTQTSQKSRERMILDLITYTPREEIVRFHTYGEPVTMEDVSTQLPNLKGLHFEESYTPDH